MTKSVFIITVAVTSIFIAGCASVNVQPPSKRNVDNSRTYNMGYEKTWVRAVDWFANHNVTIDKIKKNSGLLTAKYKLSANNTYLDCGKIDTSGFLGEPNINRMGSLNVTVRSKSENRTRVHVNFFGEFHLRGQDSWDGRPVTYEGTCVSTGKIESNILTYISSGL